MAAPRVNLAKVRRKNGVVYRLDYRVNGKRIRESLGSNKQDAELVRAQRQCDLLLGKYKLASPTQRPISLSHLVTEFLESKKNEVRETSLTRYKNYLSRLTAFMSDNFPVPSADIQSIQAKYLREFIDHMLNHPEKGEKPWAKKTVNGAIMLMKSLFKFAIENKHLTENPASKIKELRLSQNGKADFFSDEELVKIWTTIEPHWVPALKFIVHTGLRKAEMINLQWNNVDLTPGNEQITVESYDTWETKTGNSRTIPLNSEAVGILRARQSVHPTYVFTSPENHKIHPDKPYKALKRALATLGLNGDVHKLRHTFASKLAAAGTDMNTVRELLGHTDLQTTQIYTHLTPQHLKSAVGKLVVPTQ